MSKMKSWLGALVIGVFALMIASPARAQYRPWPSPLPAAPNWGDYDNRHVFHDAGWWWQNQPDWARQNHPEWWGDFDEAHDIANGIDYGLSTALYSRDVNLAFRAMRDLEAGITYINAPTIGAEVHLPFGGVKHTGNGHREGGTGALDFYTTWKSVYFDYSDKLQRAQIDTGE